MGFVIALVAIAINVAFAMYAGGIAEQKGYSKGNWIARVHYLWHHRLHPHCCFA